MDMILKTFSEQITNTTKLISKINSLENNDLPFTSQGNRATKPKISPKSGAKITFKLTPVAPEQHGSSALTVGEADDTHISFRA